jgi:hypothetical protein
MKSLEIKMTLDNIAMENDTAPSKSLNITIDASATTTKICYSYHDDNGELVQGFLSQPSAIKKLNRHFFDEYQDKADQNTALVFADRNYWMVGEQAAKMHETNPGISKTQTVIPKVLAGVGQVLRSLGYEQSQVDLRIALLLPLSEESLFRDTANTLENDLRSFLFNTGQIDCNVLSAQCYVEGSGIASTLTEPGSVIIMFGHRDISVLPVENGSIGASSKTFVGEGMIQYLSVLKSANLDEIALAIAIFSYVVFNNPTKLKAIAGSGFERLEKSILPAKELIWSQLLLKFQSVAALTQAETVVAVGGNAPFWKNELIATYGITRLSRTNANLQKLIKSVYPAVPKSLAPRLTDAFALHQNLFL